MSERAEDATTQSGPIPRRMIAAGGVTVLAVAVVLGRVYGIAVSVLLLAAAALVGVVAFVFRTMQSVAEPPDEDVLADLAPTDAAARKLAALRALKDIDYEHALGNLNDEDHAELSARYRAQAKQAMRVVDEERKERRARAEALATEEIARRAREDAKEEEERDPKAAEEEADETSERDEAKPSAKPRPKSERRTCKECATENDPDARFCKTCGGAMTEAEE